MGSLLKSHLSVSVHGTVLAIWVTAGKRKMILLVYCSDTKLSLQIENTEQIKEGKWGTCVITYFQLLRLAILCLTGVAEFKTSVSWVSLLLFRNFYTTSLQLKGSFQTQSSYPTFSMP